MEFKKSISLIVFWGAAWGTIEATLGTLLHAADFNMGWLLWFPIAFYFMNKVYKLTGKCESIILISIIAASIKLIDLALPIRIDKVVNPSASILLEGLVVFITFKIMNKYSNLFKFKILEFTVICLSWRILYAVYVLFLPSWMVAISPIRGFAPFFRFLLLEGIANIMFILIITILSERINTFYRDRESYLKRLFLKIKFIGYIQKIYHLQITPVGLLIVAIFVQWAL